VLAASLLLAAPPVLSFDGSGYLVVPAAAELDMTGEATLEAWVRPAKGSEWGYFNYILSKNMDNTGYGLLTVGRERKRFQGTGWPYGLDAPEAGIAPGRWTHVALVRSTSQAVLYVNGRERARSLAAAPLRPNDLPLSIGGSPFGNGGESCNWTGEIKEVRLWRVARSGRNLRRTMNSRLSGREAELAAYFPLSGHLRDLTGHTRPLTTEGTPPIWVRS
jgi:hypothetical protein